MNPDLLAPVDQSLIDKATPIHTISEGGKELETLSFALRRLAELNRFHGESGVVLRGEDGVLVGLGSKTDPFAIAIAAEKLGEGDYVVANGATEADALAWLMGGYRFDRYKSGKKPSARLIAPETIDVARVRRIAGAIALARDLVNTPAGDMLPDALENTVRKVADAHGAEIDVILGDKLLEKGFPLIHAVGRASTTPPRLIDLKWGKPDAPRVTLIGKGVCFDSGGLDIKSASGMAIMKKDMGGAANALALAGLVMSAGLNVNLRLLIPAVENAVAGNAFRPGDILPSRKGLSVEIGNTDAEGRLVLADAMALAGETPSDITVTLATLTGAARVALGPDLPPFYCDDEGFATDLLTSSTKTFDPVWRMPLWAPYDAMITSPIADVNNSGEGGFAGSITAALFLKKFAPKEGLWAHFDIYAWRPKALPGRPVGGEAQAIRALFDLFEKRYSA